MRPAIHDEPLVLCIFGHNFLVFIEFLTAGIPFLKKLVICNSFHCFDVFLLTYFGLSTIWATKCPLKIPFHTILSLLATKVSSIVHCSMYCLFFVSPNFTNFIKVRMDSSKWLNCRKKQKSRNLIKNLTLTMECLY